MAPCNDKVEIEATRVQRLSFHEKSGKRYLCLPSFSELNDHRNVDLVCPLEVGSWHGQLIAVEVEEVLQVIAEGRPEIRRLAHQIDDWILTSERNHLNLFLECWWTMSTWNIPHWACRKVLGVHASNSIQLIGSNHDPTPILSWI